MTLMEDTTKYVNVETGSIDTRDGWWYEDEEGEQVNAVDRGEVVADLPEGDEYPTIVVDTDAASGAEKRARRRHRRNSSGR